MIENPWRFFLAKTPPSPSRSENCRSWITNISPNFYGITVQKVALDFPQNVFLFNINFDKIGPDLASETLAFYAK